MNIKAWSLLPFALFYTLLGCNSSTPTATTKENMFIKTPASQKVFNVGDEFNTIGLNIINPKTMLDVTGYTTSIEEGYVFAGKDIGKRTVEITKEGYNPISYEITVKNYKKMEIRSLPRTEYCLYDNFSSAGLVVVDTNSGAEISGPQCSIMEGTLLEEEGTFTVTVSKTGYVSVTYDIHVSDYPYLEVTKKPITTMYSIGDTFTLEGLEISSNGQIITDYEVKGKYQEGDIIDEGGEAIFTISKEGYHSVTFAIIVYSEKIMSIAAQPNKTSYVTGEAFDSTGLIVKDYDDNVITDYSLSIADGEIIKNPGSRDVVISKNGYRDISFRITVSKNSEEYTVYKSLNIYYINDTHGSFTRLDDYNEAGMSCISTYIKENKYQDALSGKYTLTLSGGDMFQGGLESNETRGSIMIDAMNEIGFDAMVLGNHEFDWGESYIQDFADQLDCPILSCNTFYSSDNKTRPSFVTPFAVVQKDDLKIGIIGSAEAGMGSSISGSISDKFYFPSPVSYVKEFSDTLRLTYNCDIVIGGFHDGGYESSEESTPSKFTSLTEVNSTTGRRYLDAMFFAHDHQRKSGVLNTVPFLEAGSNSKYVGVLTLNLKGNGYSYTTNGYSAKNVYAPTNCTVNDPAIDSLMDKYSDVIGDPNEVIYTFKHSYEYSIDGRKAFAAIACEAMMWYVNEKYPVIFGNTRVYFASHNYQGIRQKVPAGPLTRQIFAKVFTFDNALYIQTCTKQQITNMSNSSYYSTVSATNIQYDSKGYTHAVTIAFIAESSYARNRYQTECVGYAQTAKMALELFLRLNIRDDL